MRNVNHYTYRVVWSAAADEYVGQVVEFPSLSWLAAIPTAAFEGIHAVVSEVVADMEANGEVVPNPFSERQYSGEFKVRIPPELHRALVIQAAEGNVSLNRLVSSRLAS